MSASASAPTLESPTAAPGRPAPCDAPPAGEAQGSSPCGRPLAAQREVLQRRLGDLQGHLDYLDRKILYWRAVEAGDRAAAAAIAQEIHHRTTSASSPKQP